jgi:hypothetical protein
MVLVGSDQTILAPTRASVGGFAQDPDLISPHRSGHHHTTRDWQIASGGTRSGAQPNHANDLVSWPWLCMFACALLSTPQALWDCSTLRLSALAPLLITDRRSAPSCLTWQSGMG